MYPPQRSSKLGTINNVSVATTSTSAASSAFGSQTYQIRIAASAACYFLVGGGLSQSDPTAAATSVLLPANQIDYVKVTPGQKVAVFSPTVQTVSVVEVTG